MPSFRFGTPNSHHQRRQRPGAMSEKRPGAMSKKQNPSMTKPANSDDDQNHTEEKQEHLSNVQHTVIPL